MKGDATFIVNFALTDRSCATASPESPQMPTPLDTAYDRLTRAEAERAAVIADCTQADMPLVYITRAFEDQTGYTPTEAIGTNCRFLQGPETDPADIAAIRQALREQRSLTIDILNYRKDGTPFWNRLRLRPIFRDGALDTYVGVQNPIPEAEVVRGPKFDTPAVERPANPAPSIAAEN
jgi:PAS domain S-box-containing protein